MRRTASRVAIAHRSKHCSQSLKWGRKRDPLKWTNAFRGYSECLSETPPACMKLHSHFSVCCLFKAECSAWGQFAVALIQSFTSVNLQHVRLWQNEQLGWKNCSLNWCCRRIWKGHFFSNTRGGLQGTCISFFSISLPLFFTYTLKTEGVWALSTLFQIRYLN